MELSAPASPRTTEAAAVPSGHFLSEEGVWKWSQDPGNWLILLHMMISSSIHFLENNIISFF
jgi:hypothetical protein